MRRQRGHENKLIRGRVNLSAHHESLTKLLAHGVLAVEMVMLNYNKRQQKYQVSEVFKADPKVIKIIWVSVLNAEIISPLDYLFSKPVALVQNCILC